MISLDDVSVRFGGKQAVSALSLEPQPGRTTVLIGPSGSGKSTVLRMIIGLLRPDSGSVRVNGAALSPENVNEARHRIGYVIQDGGLFPHLSARANVALLARHLGRDAKWISGRVAVLAGLVRIPLDALSRYPSGLSGGERQRVALMRALMLDPEVLLLDEPLAALDPIIRRGLQADLKEIFARLGKTVVLVTHDLNEAAWFGDEIVLMRTGQVVQRGKLEDLLTRPAEPFVTEFVHAQRVDPRLAAA
jgi:osmoprotectant transport system ATP-binding protein